jgi:membrane protease YdiL (CAAX protease family)
VNQQTIRPRESVAVLLYFALYLGYLFIRLEGEILHWFSLVVLPLALIGLMRQQASLRELLASVGLARAYWKTGLLWAVLLGLLLSALQLVISRQGREIAGMLLTPRVLYLFPLSFGVMLLTAGFTEEFFFRGVLQTRLAALLHSTWIAVVVTSILFGFYHLPYAYLNPRWPSHGNWPAAFGAAFGQAVPLGLILGTLFVRSRSNLLACAILHALINSLPAMAALKFSS